RSPRFPFVPSTTLFRSDVTARRFPDRTSEIAEVIAFLKWLCPNFVFLGYDAWGRVDRPDEALAAVAEADGAGLGLARPDLQARRAEEHTSEHQSPQNIV